MPWFLMSYEGRLLQQITDRMVSYNSLFLSLFLDSFSHKSHSILSLCGHKRRVSSPHSTHKPTPTPRRAFVVLSVSSLSHVHCSLSQESAGPTDLVAIRKLS